MEMDFSSSTIWTVENAKTRPKPHLSKTFIKAWRLHRGLSQEALAARMETVSGGAVALSAVSIGRIEKSLQPYSQPILEAMALAMQVPVVALIARDPAKKDAPWDVWESLSPEQRRTLAAVLEAERKERDDAQTPATNPNKRKARR